MKLNGYYHNSKEVSIKKQTAFQALYCLFFVYDHRMPERGINRKKQRISASLRKVILFDKQYYFIIIIL